jgi:gliding motility-associated-like protein
MMIKFFALFFCLPGLCFGQLLQNPSLEGTPETSMPPPGWSNCNQYSTADTQPGSWLVDKVPSDGSSYISLVTRGPNGNFNDGFTEAAGTQLLEPFQSNACYRLTLDLAFFAQFDGGSTGGQGTWRPVKLKVWASTGACAKDRLLWESGVVSNQEWQSYQVDFVVDKTYSHLILEAGYAGSEIYNGNILIDNLNISKNQVNVSDVFLCQRGDVASVQANASGASILWSTGSTETSIEVAEEGTYWIKAEKDGCTAIDTFTVTFAKPLKVRLGSDIVRCVGDTVAVLLDATAPNGKYEWSTGETTPTITVWTPGVYRVRVDNGCTSAEDEIEVSYSKQCCLISAPNVFTPNGDSFNDFFEVSGGTNIGRFNLQICNRWGKLVYESKDLSRFWDGDLPNGQEAAPGVYFWRIDILCIRNNQIDENNFKGTVTLLR